ncbi:putative non-specific serine/threonine protein kinase [Helianthus annuus]|uniref:Non-specific serine/threonine protein kinase n=1 Tax=Helianthus annuus TaxID=4232 RepID=A0A9K3ED81_HELAN|nr:putative non-specific serine/threonine protein kinase [Helianthus annuus]KAJ0465607.1 putative non-specific serine/threonine protein kinase [Helianthus annuus]KAJ0470478.1 putative non-specific serine/threonine protein kinase [Helianthus annuus]KAJ0487200.1 putative non-specific serine/threonine protein kinase [Helianthus annuus]KAJ0661314.1 putative non-specific serine/threonine protein kinase [Helianthus annuus]
MRALARLLFFSSALFSVLLNSAVLDTINTGQALRDDDTLVSAGETYELGFFSPGNSKNRYLGIWFKKIGKITKMLVDQVCFQICHPPASLEGLLSLGSVPMFC